MADVKYASTRHRSGCKRDIVQGREERGFFFFNSRGQAKENLYCCKLSQLYLGKSDRERQNRLMSQVQLKFSNSPRFFSSDVDFL